MKIRTRLLLFILPCVLGTIFLVSFFIYHSWYKDIVSCYRAGLEGLVISASESIDPEDQQWLVSNRKSPEFTSSNLYKKYVTILKNIQKKLPIESIYVIHIPENAQEKAFKSYIIDSEDFVHLQTRTEPATPEELEVIKTKEPLVTNVYFAKETEAYFITGYAPITDEKGTFIALVAADINMRVIDEQVKKMQGIIVVLAILSVIIIMIGVAFIANNFSRLVEQLKSSALMIAAGHYGKKIEATGPLEIQELANTLNTMSECMQENVLRIEESSLLREKMIGESEALRLLQSRIVSDFLEEFTHTEFSLYAIDKPGNDTQRIFFFDAMTNTDTRLDLVFTEATKVGFDGIVSLLKHDSDLGTLQISLEKQDSDSWQLTTERTEMPAPLIWSSEKETLFVAKEKEQLQPEDLLIIVNFGLDRAMRHEDSIQKWFTRVFSHFAHEGIDTCMALLNNELSFLSERQQSHAPLLAVCLQRKTNR